MDDWEKMYTLMRLMRVPRGDATRIANIATGQCREQPDDQGLLKKAKENLESMKGKELAKFFPFLGVENNKTDPPKLHPNAGN